jgi:hypothetical protein
MQTVLAILIGIVAFSYVLKIIINQLSQINRKILYSNNEN